MKRIILSLVLCFSGCSASTTITPEQIEQKIKQHEVTLGLIVDYVARLQEIGMLPKPADLEKRDESSK